VRKEFNEILRQNLLDKKVIKKKAKVEKVKALEAKKHLKV
jgi:hypothetical protein